MTEYDMEDGFVGEIADYVSTECNRVEDFGMLSERLRRAVGDKPEEWDQHITCYYAEEISGDDLAQIGILSHVLPEAYFIFRATYKEQYFQRRFEKFKKLAESITLEQFASSIFVYDIERCLDEPYGVYITDEDSAYQTLDKFVRNELSFGKQSKFWLGSTLDYHW